jgi:hypothetical protein
MDEVRARTGATDLILLGENWLIWPQGTSADDSEILDTLYEAMRGTRCMFAAPK